VQVVSELSAFRPPSGTLLTVGVFDGVHLGHRHLISRMTERAAEASLLSGVVTFSCHPKAVLSPHTKLALLTTLEDRVNLLRELGIDLVVPLAFDTELAALSAREFVVLLQRHLRMEGLIIGPDFAMGRGREGDALGLERLGQELGFTVEVVEPLRLGDTVVSSTAVRRALAQGDMGRTATLLGRHFSLSGPVVAGIERGQVLGYPTANLAVDSEQAVPADGVYATLAHVGADVYRSVTNIGVRPTFGGGARTIEAFLMDFVGDLYGEKVTLDLVERLRGEMKFADADDLTRQIGKDVEHAKDVLR
jgi:riboflavin kinase/FMN adenylyltransferase